MTYPLIHALSTVGVLKHYNQDYLIHRQRTDFTGANGVGKSIIADLLQLIFINDKQLFQFGTEGYKKEARQIHKLPYKCRDAYAFLTVEVEENKFICIGVTIPNNSTRPLKPFLITLDPNNQLPFSDRVFPKEQIPLAKHFINDKNQICLVEDLGRHFRDKYDLYFEYYSSREQKDEHYARLYDQYLLPINLSIPSSLKTFAKIIQSFSRARSGGDKSEELKDFLFDGVEQELEHTFDSYKSEIDKLLRDYDDLHLFINDLEAKQSQLEELSKLLEIQNKAQRKFLIGTCGYSFANSNRANVALNLKIREYETAVQKAGLLTRQLPRFQALADGYKALLTQSKRRLDAINSCAEIVKSIEEVDKQINNLTFTNLPVIVEPFNGQNPIDEYDSGEIIRRYKAFVPIYQQYKSISAIEQQIERQKKIIQERKAEVSLNIKYYKLVNDLFRGSTEKSLIAQVLKSDKTISTAQEAVLFHFIKTNWQKPELPGFPFYADGFEFFDDEQIIQDERLGGYWLRLKDLSIHIESLKHEPVLGNTELRSKAISDLLIHNQTIINSLNKELEQLDLFEKGKVYELKYATVLIGLDERLYDYEIKNQLAITAQLILQLEDKIDGLQKERSELLENKALLLVEVGIDKNFDLQKLFEIENSNFECWQHKVDKFHNRVITDRANLNAMRETSIPALEQQSKDKKELANRATVKYLEDRVVLEKAYPDLITETFSDISEEDLQDLNRQYDNERLNYESSYKAACKLFKETADDNNLEIKIEVGKGNFSFPILERALLGSKIRFHDQIAEELRTANRTRHNIIDSIHETMLKIFMRTKTKYEEYRTQIRDLNLFFKGKSISNKYFFQVGFVPNPEVPIEWINQLQSQSQHLYKPGELPMGNSVELFVEEFFKTAARYKKKIAFRDLLDPKTYFTLDAGLINENGNEVPGSTGETYSAKVLLGIGRLSKVQSQNRPGIRFIILEETANLDKTNFNNFPAIAEEFGYQIITMTPKPFGADATEGWYLHHLLPGKHDPDINYPVPASYFKTNTNKEDLLSYLNRVSV
jgi:exonuclease SbcC